MSIFKKKSIAQIRNYPTWDLTIYAFTQVRLSAKKKSIKIWILLTGGAYSTR